MEQERSNLAGSLMVEKFQTFPGPISLRSSRIIGMYGIPFVTRESLSGCSGILNPVTVSSPVANHWKLCLALIIGDPTVQY